MAATDLLFAGANGVSSDAMPNSRDRPASRSFVFVSGWHDPFDVEVDCIAAA